MEFLNSISNILYTRKFLCVFKYFDSMAIKFLILQGAFIMFHASDILNRTEEQMFASAVCH